MRRSLIRTVAATTVIVLIALLVPMAVLVGRYALEDRVARAALEVQATETVVSRGDKGSVAVYLATANDRDDGVRTTVLFPDGTALGPDPGEDQRVREARTTGRARLDNIPGGRQILVPLAIGASSDLPEATPVIRVQVTGDELAADVRKSWSVLGLLGVALLIGSLLVADRLGRSFVQPVLGLAETARRLSTGDRSKPVTADGPPEVCDVGIALDGLVARVDELIARERAGVTDLAHRLRTPVTRLRLGVESLDLDPQARGLLNTYVDSVDDTVDEVIRESRRSEREGLAARVDVVEVVGARAEFWRPLTEDQHRALAISLPADPLTIRASPRDLEVLVDALLDNVVSYTPDGTAVHIVVGYGDEVVLEVSDDGPGFPPDFDPLTRGGSATGSTGLGLDIVRRTAEAAGGSVEIGASPSGGARVTVRLGRALEYRTPTGPA
ncbi:MAG: ATP-binding protein [Sporichthyaceae bacterium]